MVLPAARQLLKPALAALLLALPQLAGAGEMFTVPVDKEFTDIEQKWNNGRVTYRGKWTVILAKDGTIAVCGAGARLDAQTAPAVAKWLHSIAVKVNGKTVLKDMSFFTEVSSTAPLEKAKATCKSSGVKPPKGKVEIFMTSPPMSARL